MGNIRLDLKPCDGFFNVSEYDKKLRSACESAELLEKGRGRGSEFTGWLNLPLKIDDNEKN